MGRSDLMRFGRIILAVLAVADLATVADTAVGVWMDNGQGRTVLADQLDAEEAAGLARDILDVLDLPTPPQGFKGRHHHTPRPHHAQGSAPMWLKGIYDTIDERGHATSSNLDESHRVTVSAADTIITFVSRDPPGGNHIPGANRGLYFDLGDVPLDHSLLGAELRVHRRAHTPEVVLLHVHLKTDEQGGEKEIATAEMEASGWVSVNISGAALSWMLFPDSNLGLRLSVTSLHRRHERRFHEVGVSGSKDEEEFRPFMVGFFALPDSPYHKRKRIRTTRSVPNTGPPPTTRNRSYREVADRTIGSDTWCRLKHLHVSFRDLGWENWVIAPEGYDANYCEGHCVFPLHAKMNASNHALVQTLVKLVEGVPHDQLPPNACCAPIDLATIPVLYYSYENNIVLKKYPKMIVKTCGCL